MKNLRQALCISFISAVGGAAAVTLIDANPGQYSHYGQLFIPAELQDCESRIFYHKGEAVNCVEREQLPPEIARQIRSEESAVRFDERGLPLPLDANPQP